MSNFSALVMVEPFIGSVNIFEKINFVNTSTCTVNGQLSCKHGTVNSPIYVLIASVNRVNTVNSVNRMMKV